jgi:hypothetical protein
MGRKRRSDNRNMIDERTARLLRELEGEMNGESDLFSRLGAQMDEMCASSQGNVWSAGGGWTGTWDEYASKIEEVEAKRDAAFQALAGALGLSPYTHFSAMAERIPMEERVGLEESYRRLRSAVVRFRISVNRLRYLAFTLSETMGKVLEEVLPHRRGRIYSRKGRAAAAAGNPLLVNQQL